MNILQTDFYARDTIQVARELLGKLLVREYEGKILSGIITETEAYLIDDPACHAFKGRTSRTQALFGPVGHAYIYFIYGNHFCLNAVARLPEVAAGGVLIRSIKPIDGITVMKQLRGNVSDKDLTNGPGKLTQALAITKEQYGHDLKSGKTLYILDQKSIDDSDVHITPRIGISQAKDKLWRFLQK
jgi:DNA-3-methyladenine glycosylase